MLADPPQKLNCCQKESFHAMIAIGLFRNINALCRYNMTLQELMLVREKLGIPAMRRHIFLCCDQSKPKCCDKELSVQSWEYLKHRLKELKLSENGGMVVHDNMLYVVTYQGKIMAFNFAENTVRWTKDM
jgi:hypothetical protein